MFISETTHEDDDFVLWLAPRLQATRYIVLAGLLSIDPGDRWRREITETLQNKAVQIMLCCLDATLNKAGVQEEISIVSDVVKELKDPRLIISLRLAPFTKELGIGYFNGIYRIQQRRRSSQSYSSTCDAKGKASAGT